MQPAEDRETEVGTAALAALANNYQVREPGGSEYRSPVGHMADSALGAVLAVDNYY